MGSHGKNNAIWWNIKINLQKSVGLVICEYELTTNLRNSQKNFTELKIFQKVLGGYFFETPGTFNSLVLWLYLYNLLDILSPAPISRFLTKFIMKKFSCYFFAYVVIISFIFQTLQQTVQTPRYKDGVAKKILWQKSNFSEPAGHFIQNFLQLFWRVGWMINAHFIKLCWYILQVAGSEIQSWTFVSCQSAMRYVKLTTDQKKTKFSQKIGAFCKKISDYLRHHGRKFCTTALYPKSISCSLWIAFCLHMILLSRVKLFL